MASEISQDLIDRLAVLRELCADMRFGQTLATLNLLAEDMTDGSLWEIEDDALVAVMERFRQDLTRRQASLLKD